MTGYAGGGWFGSRVEWGGVCAGWDGRGPGRIRVGEVEAFDLGEMMRKLPSTREGRWEVMRRIFAGWIKPIVAGDGYWEEEMDAAEARLKVKLPAALREWYQLAGRRNEVWSCQDMLLRPERLRVEEGRLAICDENQGCVVWGIEMDALGRADPAVMVRDWEGVWAQETADTSTFALARLMMDLKFCERRLLLANGEATAEALEVIGGGYERVDMPRLHWPDGTEHYAGVDVLIEVNSQTWIWVTGREEGAFSRAVERIGGAGVEWVDLAE
jgi:hypothetical protein